MRLLEARTLERDIAAPSFSRPRVFRRFSYHNRLYNIKNEQYFEYYALLWSHGLLIPHICDLFYAASNSLTSGKKNWYKGYKERSIGRSSRRASQVRRCTFASTAAAPLLPAPAPVPRVLALLILPPRPPCTRPGTGAHTRVAQHELHSKCQPHPAAVRRAVQPAAAHDSTRLRALRSQQGGRRLRLATRRWDGHRRDARAAVAAGGATCSMA